MALIKSTILAQISGSINGITFAHNKGGAYARNRSIPSNPGTDRQDQVRTSLTSLSKAWVEALTQQQRNSWINWGANQTVTNRLGDSIQLSGIAAFQRVNLFRLATLGQAMVTSPPPPPVRDPAPVFVSAASSSNTPATDAKVIINLNGAPTGYSMAVYYSGVVSPGVRYYRGPWLGRTTEAIASANQVVTLPGLEVSSLGGEDIVLRVILYGNDDSLPIWEVFTDPIELTI